MKCMILLFSLLVVSLQALSAQGKDPHLRDENISDTKVTVSYERDKYGNYIYTYTVDSSSANLGHISSFDIDIECNGRPYFSDFDASLYKPTLMDDSSRNHLHVPVVIKAVYGQAALFGINRDNTASWGVFLDPGESSHGLKIISPAAPGSRQYILTPSMINARGEWDYSGYNEFDNLPWTDDFTVYGTTIGPVCPREPQPNEPRFAGTVMDGESDGANNLLTYSRPLKDRFHIPAGTGQIAITIHYEKYIDPDTFHITPQRPEYRNLFHPEPGTSETVYFPLSHKKTKLILRIQPQLIVGQESVKNKYNQYTGPQDRDVFEIRLE